MRVRSSRWACASTAATPAHFAKMAERLLTDEVRRHRRVAEAPEGVLPFDWADVARQTVTASRELVGQPATSSADSAHTVRKIAQAAERFWRHVRSAGRCGPLRGATRSACAWAGRACG